MCPKLNTRSSCEAITWPTDRGGNGSVPQVTLNASIHSPGGDPTHVPSNTASEGKGLTRTD